MKNGEFKEKKTIKLRDDSEFQVELTLWGDHAVNIIFQKNLIVAF